MMETRRHAQQKAAPPPFVVPGRGGVLQRKCACGRGAGLAGDCEACSQQKFAVQRSTQNSRDESRNPGGMPPVVHEVLSSPGQPLDSQTRAFMEPRFGHDFSRVRVHTDARAGEATQSVNAEAFTVGQAIVFAQNKYVPQTRSGKELLTHELAHVVQQSGVALSRLPQKTSQPNDSFEREADSVAHNVLAPAELGNSSESHLQRKVAPVQGAGSAKSERTESSFIRCLNSLMQSCQWRYDDIKSTFKNRPFSRQTYDSINSTLHSYLGEGMAIACDHDNNYFCCGKISSVFIREGAPDTSEERNFMPNYGPDNQDEIGMMEQEVPVQGGSYFIDISVDVSLTAEDCCEPQSPIV